MYVYWNDMLYAEVTAYGGLNQSTLEVLGDQPGPTPDQHPGLMPYWRLALEPHWGDHYLMVGTFGMYSQTEPGRFAGRNTATGRTSISTSASTRSTSTTATSTA